jgi:hypothetical protein
MKLRLKGNSMRLRLSRGDLDRLCRDGLVSETTRFGSGSDSVLRYALVADQAAAVLQTSFGSSGVVVTLPAAEVARWAQSDEVTLGAVQVVGSERLAVTVEKDFQCLKPRPAAEDSDTFRNPAPAHTC